MSGPGTAAICEGCWSTWGGLRGTGVGAWVGGTEPEEWVEPVNGGRGRGKGGGGGGQH